MIKVCKYLFDEIQFIQSRIVPCASFIWDEDKESAEKYFIKPDENTSSEVIGEYLEYRNKYISMYKNGEIPEFCKDCISYCPVDINENEITDFTFNKLYIKEQSVCNCRCAYCCLAGENNDLDDFERMNKEKYYIINPIVEELEKREMINRDTQIYILGGEPTLYPKELDYVIDVCLRYDSRFTLFTNGIIYDENVAKMLKRGNSEVFCSIDAGSKSTFEKIKRLKVYDRVINNLTKYANSSKENNNSFVRLKYLIYPPYNDNLDEFKKFVKLSSEIGAKQICLSMDIFWFNNNKNKPVPKKIKEIVRYYSKLTEYEVGKKDIEYSMFPKWYVDKAMEEIHKENIIVSFINKMRSNKNSR